MNDDIVLQAISTALANLTGVVKSVCGDQQSPDGPQPYGVDPTTDPRSSAWDIQPDLIGFPNEHHPQFDPHSQYGHGRYDGGEEYAADSRGHEHKESGPGGGQFTSKGNSGGSSDPRKAKKPAGSPMLSQPSGRESAARQKADQSMQAARSLMSELAGYGGTPTDPRAGIKSGRWGLNAQSKIDQMASEFERLMGEYDRWNSESEHHRKKREGGGDRYSRYSPAHHDQYAYGCGVNDGNSGNLGSNGMRPGWWWENGQQPHGIGGQGERF